MSSHTTVDRVPALCSGGHGFDSCRDEIFFFFTPCSCHVDRFTFHNFTFVSNTQCVTSQNVFQYSFHMYITVYVPQSVPTSKRCG